VLVEVGQLRRWTGSGRWRLSARGGGVFIVLSQRKTFVDSYGDVQDVQDLAWNYLASGGEEWQWDDVLVGSSEVVSD